MQEPPFPSTQEIEEIKTHFRKTLNSHGYSFQYSVLKLAEKLLTEGKSYWALQAAEFPVESKGSNTHIDFILKRLRYNAMNTAVFIVGECKRANPATSNWCFAKAPYLRQNRSLFDPWIMEFMQINTEAARANELYWINSSANQKHEESYHIALEIKSKQPGEPEGHVKGAIETAASQVCRGLSGFIESVARNTKVLGSSTSAIFLPVIFTTARLYTSSVDLSESSLLTGKLDSATMDLTEKPFLFYQYHLSPSLKHSLKPSTTTYADLGELLEFEFARTILVVSANGIEQFLQWLSNYEFS